MQSQIDWRAHDLYDLVRAFFRFVLQFALQLRLVIRFFQCKLEREYFFPRHDLHKHTY